MLRKIKDWKVHLRLHNKKNFLLTNEVSMKRKIKEAILAFRIERAYTKERILELI